MGRTNTEYAPGTLLAPTKWEVVEELGRGGMGVVLHVKKAPGIHAVAKIITRDLAKRAEFRERFLQEVRIQASLINKHVVRVTDYEELADGTPFFLMEKLNGKTLGRVMRERGKPLPADVVHYLMTQLLEGLYAAHTHSEVIVHRDIKPENIFLTDAGELKILDFGVARALSDAVKENAVYGTLGWASPEQLTNGPITPQTDLYAAGLLLFYMVTGRVPFDKYKNEARIAKAHVDEESPSILDFAPWVPQPIDDLRRSALAKDPKDRPRDAYAFMAQLFALTWAKDGTNVEESLTPNTTAPTVATLATSVMVKQLGDIKNQSTVRDMAAPPVDGRTLELAPPEVQREVAKYLENERATRNVSVHDTDVGSGAAPFALDGMPIRETLKDAHPKKSLVNACIEAVTRVFRGHGPRITSVGHDGNTLDLDRERRALEGSLDRKARTSTLPPMPQAASKTDPLPLSDAARTAQVTDRASSPIVKSSGPLPQRSRSRRRGAREILEGAGLLVALVVLLTISWKVFEHELLADVKALFTKETPAAQAPAPASPVDSPAPASSARQPNTQARATESR